MPARAGTGWILAALISAPSFDPLFRGDIIKIPAGHPIYRWNCWARCERTVMGHGDLCGAHEVLWRKHRAEGGTRADFLQAAQPLGPGEGVEEQPCRICADRPACHVTLRLCHYHQFRWYNYRDRHGDDADFTQWLACQEASVGYGRCRVHVCPETAFSPLGLCSRHEARYHRDGSPGGAALPSQWGTRYERTGRDVPVEYADEPAPPVVRDGRGGAAAQPGQPPGPAPAPACRDPVGHVLAHPEAARKVGAGPAAAPGWLRP